jgi:hypothetical protein
MLATLAPAVLTAGETDGLAITRRIFKLFAHSVASRLGHTVNDDDVLTIAARREVLWSTAPSESDDERVVSISAGNEVLAAVPVKGVVAWPAEEHVVAAQATDPIVTSEPEDPVILRRTVEPIAARGALDHGIGRAVCRDAESQRKNDRSSKCRRAHHH